MNPPAAVMTGSFELIELSVEFRPEEPACLFSNSR